MTRVDYTFLLNHLKINIAKKRYFFDLLVNTKILNLITLLHRLSIIRRFVKLPNGKYRIYLTWFNKHSKPVVIKSVKRSTNFIHIKSKSLSILSSRTLNSHLILSTSKGLITHHDAKRFNVGGFLICTIL